MAHISTLLLVLSSTSVLGEDNLRRMSRSRQIDHYELFNVAYNLSQASQTVSSEHVLLAEKSVQNNSPYDTTSTLSMEITQTTTSEWSEINSHEIHAGLTITVSAPLPFRAKFSAEFEIGTSFTSSYSYGESHTTSETTVQEVSVDLPAYSAVKVSMIAKETDVNVPYTATLKTVYTDKGSYQRNVSGVYRNAHQTALESVIEAIPFNNTQVSGAIQTSPVWSKTFMLTFHLGFLIFLS
ncbi:Natterin-2 [Holothuria leucospilota]|uniref:Natterin-2 n=1 Tax=Holothuria leucospilota TaxID=206669 RepID=A0A9Q1GXV3_HOLLE|nr:Natterin-2 [Holothuria leucospilota]